MTQAERLLPSARVQDRCTRPYRYLLLVLALGLVIRAVLIPLTQGQDFVVWDLGSSATLRGVDVYAHHPHYPGGPYAYFPLFLDIELPFQWLAEHTGLPFTTLGKLPILAGDVATAWLIAAELRDRNVGHRAAAVGAALFFLNPLVIYNSAFYGRFDSVGCALLLLALRQFRRHGRASVLVYGLAVAAKTFPGFLLAGVVRAARTRVRVVVGLLAVLTTLSLPYLGSLGPYLRDIVLYDSQKTPQGLSWQTLVTHSASAAQGTHLGYLLLGVFAFATVWLSSVRDLHRYAVLTLVLFLLCSKVVLEQYLTWPMPLIAVAVWTTSRRAGRASLAALAVLTFVGMTTNESFHPWGRSPTFAVLAVTIACLGYLAVLLCDAPEQAL